MLLFFLTSKLSCHREQISSEIDEIREMPMDSVRCRIGTLTSTKRHLLTLTHQQKNEVSWLEQGNNLACNRRGLEMKENVLDVLMYLFETYTDADSEPESDRGALRAELERE